MHTVFTNNSMISDHENFLLNDLTLDMIVKSLPPLVSTAVTAASEAGTHQAARGVCSPLP